MAPSDEFDVFLSYNSSDKDAVTQLAELLKARRIRVWFDAWELVPGRRWQDALEGIIATAKSAAVLVGSSGLGPWEDHEMRSCLSEFVGRGLSVIPVLLPDAPQKPDLPLFLRQFTWVDLRGGFTEDGLSQLEWGITGVRPNVGSSQVDAETVSNTEGGARQVSGPMTVASVEFHLAQTLSEFDEEKFKQAFQEATGIPASKVRISAIRQESIVVTIESDPNTLRQVLSQVLRPEITENLAKVLRLLRVRCLDAGGQVLEEIVAPALQLGLLHAYYVGPKDTGVPDGFPPSVVLIRDWAWTRTALLRWSHGDGEKVHDWLDKANVVILDWPGQDPESARHAFHAIRARAPRKPLLILKRGSGQDPLRNVAEKEMSTAGLEEVEAASADVVAAAFRRLDIALPGPVVAINDAERRLEVRELVSWLGEDRLRLILQIFFPDASRATIWPVGGGWSGTNLCQVFIENRTNELYFIKFFTDRDRCLDEVTRHKEAASQWLGNSLVNLRPIPELADGIETQIQAFPAVAPPSVYPVCYESAADVSCRRETLKSIYQETGTANGVEEAFRRLLEMLSQQPTDNGPIPERPGDYLDDNTEGRLFELPVAKRIDILAAAQDLAVYGRLLRKDWDQRYQAIENLFRTHLPNWLDRPGLVVKGCIHRDPNSRNCLVNPKDHRDMKLIDLGGFNTDGRLVFDLALIETDLKVCLMATETDARGLLDLHSPSLKIWFSAESESLSVNSTQITFDPNAAPITKDPAVARAYRLIAMVREQAKELSDKDPQGRHYFAALLYWTLNSLRYDSIRPTKKLLAIYSASEILRRF